MSFPSESHSGGKVYDQNQHPIFTRDYAVFTPPIQEFFDTVCDWIDNRIPGGYIHGPSRFGKSRAVRHWMKDLIDEHYFKKIPFFRAICPSRDRPSEAEFIQALLRGLRIRLVSSRSRLTLQMRISKYLCAEARSKGINFVVLMIDEAQRMTHVEYKILCNIQNLMEDYGFQITVIAVGSHELTYRHEALLLGEDMHLVGRFMVHNAAFHGIRSVEELRYVLSSYDEQTEWPPGSGVSFTKYFFPKAFSTGLRLENWAEDMWEHYLRLAPSSLQDRLQVPMENIGKAVERIFRWQASLDGPGFDVSPDDLQKAIEL